MVGAVGLQGTSCMQSGQESECSRVVAGIVVVFVEPVSLPDSGNREEAQERRESAAEVKMNLPKSVHG